MNRTADPASEHDPWSRQVDRLVEAMLPGRLEVSQGICEGLVRVLGLVRAILIPVDQARSCRVLTLPESSVAFSDAIGGGMIDEIHGPHGILHVDEHRVAKGMPVNRRADAVASRLGWDPAVLDLRGDVLLTPR